MWAARIRSHNRKLTGELHDKGRRLGVGGGRNVGLNNARERRGGEEGGGDCLVGFRSNFFFNLSSDVFFGYVMVECE